MIDKDCFGEDPIMAEILSLDTPFIDIGIPSSLQEAQNFIPEIIKKDLKSIIKMTKIVDIKNYKY